MVKRRQLNRKRVIAKAVELADKARDLDHLTLTALASSLDIRVPSLYNHVSSLEDLRQAMAEAAARELIDRLREAAAGKIGREALLWMAFAYRQFAKDHPGTYPLTIRAPDPDEEQMTALAQELLQILLLVLGSMGISGEEAIEAVRGIRSILHGFVSLEAAGGFKMDLGREESFHRLVNAYLDGLLKETPE